jgi:hypothetical protein
MPLCRFADDKASEPGRHSSGSDGSSRKPGPTGDHLQSLKTGCSYYRPNRDDNTRGTKPLSCVQCDRSKVGCDRVKPSCGRCTRIHKSHLERQSQPRKGGSARAEFGPEEVENLPPSVNSSANSNAEFITSEVMHRGERGEEEGQRGEEDATRGMHLSVRERSLALLITPQSTAGEPGDPIKFGSTVSSDVCFGFKYPQHPSQWLLGTQHD